MAKKKSNGGSGEKLFGIELTDRSYKIIMVFLGSLSALLILTIILVIVMGKGKLKDTSKKTAVTPTQGIAEVSDTPTPTVSSTSTPTPTLTPTPVPPSPVPVLSPPITVFPAGSKNGNSLFVTLKGTQGVVGVILNKEDFIVSYGKDEKSAEPVTDYECKELENGITLKEGDNKLEFKYEGVTTSLNVKAVERYRNEYAADYIAYEVSKETEKTISQIESDSLSLKDAFADWLFIGDSQVQVLGEYNILNEDSVYAEVGSNLNFLLDNYDIILKKLEEKTTLVIHTGINNQLDAISVRTKLIEDYSKLLDKLKEDRPDLRIVVTNVFPVSDKKAASDAMFGYIKSVNFMLCQMSINKGVAFVNCSKYIDQNKKLISSDGLHMETKFYLDYWLKDLLARVGI